MIFNNYTLNQEVSTSHTSTTGKKLVRRVVLFSKDIPIKAACNNNNNVLFQKALARSLCISEETAINWELKKFKQAGLVDVTSAKLHTKVSVLYLQH